MELIDVLSVLRRRWLMVVLAVVTCLGGALLATSQQPRLFQTSVQILVSGASNVSAVDEVTRCQLATQRAVAFSQIATTGPAVPASVTEALRHVPASPGYPSVTATATGKDAFLVVVSDLDPRRAAAVAAAFPVVLPQVVERLEGTTGARSAPSRLCCRSWRLPGSPPRPTPRGPSGTCLSD